MNGKKLLRLGWHQLLNRSGEVSWMSNFNKEMDDIHP